jgi:dihydrolipoamide dehydrogenase
MMPQVAPTEDEMVGTLLLREMKKRKIKALVGAKIVKVETHGEGVTARTESGEEFQAEKMLVSIGRSPNSKDLGLEPLGLELCRQGFIQVNSRMETSVPNIYAAGDVVGKALLAHKASAEAKVAVANALGKKEEIDYGTIPAVIFTFPQVASVGLKERDAKAKGIAYATSSFPFRALGKAQAIGEIAGEVKLVYEQGSLRLLGCHIIGPDAGGLIHEAALALRMKATVKDLAQTVHAHPTLSEALMEAGEAALGNAIHLPKSKS